MRSQLLTYEHEGNWSKAVESYDLLLRSKSSFQNSKPETTAAASVYSSLQQDRQYQKGLMKSLRQMGYIVCYSCNVDARGSLTIMGNEMESVSSV